jgi:DNA-binding response OmpR family regulator
MACVAIAAAVPAGVVVTVAGGAVTGGDVVVVGGAVTTAASDVVGGNVVGGNVVGGDVTGGAIVVVTAVDTTAADAVGGAPLGRSSSTRELTSAAAEPATSTPPIDISIATLALGTFIHDLLPGDARGWRSATRQGDVQEASNNVADSANRRSRVVASSTMKGVRLLLVEDDRAIAESLASGLRSDGHQVTHVATGAEALAATGYDLVLLDLGLPDIDGRDVCQQLRKRGPVPIIMLTARGDEFDRVLGLELGADDYVTKPFSRRELSARIRAVGRRTNPPPSAEETDGSDVLSVGTLRVDRRSRRAHLDGDELTLTAKEFDVLAYLAAEPGAVFTRTEILERVWDVNWYGPTKTVDAHVAALRRKLGDHRWIEAVRGVGFRLEAPP